jgi:hypothetical protein
VASLAAPPVYAQAPASEPDWAGRWRGELVNLPLRPGAAPVTVHAEIGPWPAVGGCSTWRRSFESRDHPPVTKDYRLCHGPAAGNLHIDEGNGVRLASRLVGDTLVTPFKYGQLILLSSTRLRGEVLEEEIVTVDDKPAVEGPLALAARGIQRITLRRVSR